MGSLILAAIALLAAAFLSFFFVKLCKESCRSRIGTVLKVRATGWDDSLDPSLGRDEVAAETHTNVFAMSPLVESGIPITVAEARFSKR